MLLSEISRIVNGRIITLDSDEAEGNHWVTLKKTPSGEGAARRVLLNKKGEIIGGDVPKETQGEKIDEISKVEKEEPSPVKEKKDFSGENLRGGRFIGINIDEASFKGAKIIAANFIGAKLRKADFSKAELELTNFTRADLQGADFSKTKFTSTMNGFGDSPSEGFAQANLSGANFSGNKVNHTNFSGANLAGADFSGSDLYKSTFRGVNFDDIDLSKVDLSGADLRGVQISDKAFSKLSDQNKDLIRNGRVSEAAFSGDPKKNKTEVQNKLTKATGIETEYVKKFIKKWAGTSGDDQVECIATQLIAKKVFKLDEAKTDHWKKKTVERASEIKDKEREKLVKAQYDLTQQWFKEQGYSPDDEILLYRGMKNTKVQDGEISLQPLSSFTTNVSDAYTFGTEILAMRIPVSQIFSHPKTGFGCTKESEFVVLGGVQKAVTLDVRRRGEDPTDVSYGKGIEKLYKSPMKDSAPNSREVPNLDSDLENADWTKQSWDLPKIGSPEFEAFLEDMGMSLEEFKKLPAYKGKK